ncbi:MAG: hypothetical protein ACKOAS_08210 [Verrucomicrobiota bacterium]
MKNRWFWIAFGGAAATTILACWASWILMIQPMDASVKTANALEEIFSREFGITPRLSANAGVLFSQKSRVENLITANRRITIQLTIDMPLADGNQPKLRADFICEAGIAGRDPIEINIRRGGREADITLPKPKIFSLEMSAAPIVEPPGPPWDSLPENARTRAERQLRLAARQQLLDEGLLSQADLELRSRISKLAAKADCEAVFSSKP